LIEFRIFGNRVAAAVLAGALALFAGLGPSAASGPIETSIFAVQGVEVDVTSTDAATAKNQALMDVQVKGFFHLVERLGTPELAAELQQKLKPEDIAPYLRSLSIEKETSAPGRYIGRFTVRFLPQKMQKLFGDYGIRVPTQQADPILVLPIFRGPDGNRLWEDNPWRKAWIDLKGEQGIVPVIVPLGDLEDTQSLSVDDALKGDALRLEALRKRYGAPSLLLAQAQPAEGGGLHVYIEGETKLGRVTVNKVYMPEEGGAVPVETTAVTAFQAMLVKTYRDVAEKLAAEEAARSANTTQSLSVSVPFTSPREWNAIRSRILATPNVRGVDLSTLNADGAVIRLVFTRTVEELQMNMQAAGLNLASAGSAWIIQPM
jgi:hypothetical protein